MESVINAPVDDLATLALGNGSDPFVFGHVDFEQVRRFANEVVPREREQVTVALA